MRRITSAILLTLWPALSMADDGNIFVDNSGDEPIEFEADFIDDFEDLELMGVGSHIRDRPLLSDEGDLYRGHDALMRKERSLSILGGNDTIASTYHLAFFPQSRFFWANLLLHVGIPLRFPIYDHGDAGNGFVGLKSFANPRARDFANWWDIQRAIRHFEIGEGDQPVHLRLSREHPLSLGHGELLNNLSPDGLFDQDYLFASGHFHFGHGSLGGILGPLPRAELLGINLKLIPLYSFSAPPFMRNLNLDVIYVNDFMAPNLAMRHGDDLMLDDERRMVMRQRGTAQGLSIGLTGQYFPYPWLSLRPYTSYTHLWLTGLLNDKRSGGDFSHGGGFSLGGEGTIYFLPGTKRSVLVAKGEGRIFSSRYWPGYFGPTYVIDRLVLNEPGTGLRAGPVTKSQYLSEGGDGAFRLGYLFELSYAYDGVVSATIAYENARSFKDGGQIPPLRRAHLITCIKGFDLLDLKLGFQATAIEEMAQLFDLKKNRALISLRGQLQMLSFLYFDAWAKHAFGLNHAFSSSLGDDGEVMWLSHDAETRSFNFGLGIEFAMKF